MKVKDGKIKLGKNDTQAGNFIISREKTHFKMQDVYGHWTMRVSLMHPMYTMIEECIKANNSDYLEAITKILYAIGTTPADLQMMEDLYNAYNALIGRMKERGVFPSADDESELKRAEQSYQTKEEIKKVLENGSITDTQGESI